MKSGNQERTAGCGLLVISVLAMAYCLWDFRGPEPWLDAWLAFVLSLAFALAGVHALEGGWSRLMAGARAGGWTLAFTPGDVAVWSILGLTLLLAAVLRLYNLHDLPPGLFVDEFSQLAFGMAWVSDPGNVPVWDPHHDRSSVWSLLLGLNAELFGVSIASGRIVAALSGVAGVLAVFLLAREVMGSAGGLMAAAVQATMRWDVNWSRIGMSNITTVMFSALCMYLLLRGARTGRLLFFALAGFALTGGMWMYSAFYLFPFVVSLTLFCLLVKSALAGEGWKTPVLQGCTLVAASVLAMAPILDYALFVDTETFLKRQAAVTQIRTLEETWQQVSGGFIKHIRMFHFEGDMNGRHNLPGAPMLDSISGVLLIAGALLTMVKWRNIGLLVLVPWVLVMMLPAIMTLGFEHPQSLRSIVVLPAITLMIALPLSLAWNLLARLPVWWAVWIPRLGIVLILAAIAAVNVHFYFVVMANDSDVYASFDTHATVVAWDVRESLERGDVVMASERYGGNGVARMLSVWPSPEVLYPEAGRAPLSIAGKDRVTVYVHILDTELYDLLRFHYPDADFEPITTPRGDRALYYRAILPAHDIASLQGLRLRYFDGTGMVSEKVRPVHGIIVPPGLTVDGTLYVDGALHFRDSGRYTMELRGSDSFEVRLDGRVLLTEHAPRVDFDAVMGLHRLEVKTRGDAAGPVRLLWSNNGDTSTVGMPGSMFYSGTRARPVGWLASFYAGHWMIGDERHPDVQSIVAGVHDGYVPSSYHGSVHGIELEAVLSIPQDGDYRFTVREIFGDLALEVDGALVLSNGHGTYVTDNIVYLTEGDHLVRVQFSSINESMFQIRWQPPWSLEPEPIPLTLLEPPPELMWTPVR